MIKHNKSSFYGSKREDKENVENNDTEIPYPPSFLSQLPYFNRRLRKMNGQKCK